MSGDALDRLLAVASGTAQVVQVRRRQRFETATGVAGNPVEDLQVAETGAIRTAPQAVPPPSGERSDQPEPIALARREPAAPIGQLASVARPFAPPMPRGVTRRIAAQEPAASEQKTTGSVPSQGERKAIARKPENPSETVTWRSHDRPEPVAPPEAAPRPANPLPVAPAIPAHMKRPSAHVLHAAVPAPHEAPRVAESSIPGTPDISIRIERVEINAPSDGPARESLPPRAAPKSEPTALSDYLARRHRGGW